MFELESWLEELKGKLQTAFGDRLLFWGLQGSFQRGEATDQSDIDLVTVLEAVTTAELRTYRAVVETMPASKRACGFLCGREELACWPRYDLFQLVRDTRPLIGSLELLVPPTGREEAAQAAAVGAGNLYHAVCHSALYSHEPEAALPGFYKSAFFILQARTFCRTGIYAGSRNALLPLLEGLDRAVMETALQGPPLPEGAVQQLLDWCSEVLRRPDGTADQAEQRCLESRTRGNCP
ncbi:MAG: nucleotidyltransferase domain-containing protein [Clostridiales bacterium]|nr:nucleotidyltransferase domain-containing protein [Clostridiales bacterium]